MALFCFICGIIFLPGIMKKTLIIILAASFFMMGCFKDSVHNDADTTAIAAIFDGGPTKLTSAPLNLGIADSSIVYVSAGIGSPFTLNKDITITLGINDAARIAYNQTHAVQYDSLPDSLYLFSTTSAVLTAGARSINLPLIIYGAKADLTKNYMLAITIKDAQGINITTDSATIYYNQVGSPIAGRYKITGTRTDYTGPVSGGVVAEVTDLSEIGTKVTLTQSTNVVLIDYSDLGSAGWQYIVTFNPDGKTISIAPNSVMLNQQTGFLEDSFKIDAQDYDPVNKIIHIKTEYSDLANNARVVEEFLKVR